MENTLLRWKEPLSVHKTKSKIDASFPMLVLAAFFIALAIRGVARQDYFSLIPLIVVPIMWAFNRVVPTYQISDAGVSYQNGQTWGNLWWSDIEWYDMTREETVPGMLKIQFCPRTAKFWKTPPAFVFDPQEIDKKRVLQILEQYLPQKDLHSVSLRQVLKEGED